MRIVKALCYALAVVVITLISTAIHAQDSIRKHVVQRGETLFGIGYKYGVQADDIVAANPGAEYGITPGQTLIIPIEGSAATALEARENVSRAFSKTGTVEDATKDNVPAPVVVPDSSMQLSPVNAPVALVPGTESAEDAEDAVEQDTVTIGVFMPFDLQAEKRSRAGTSALEFYKGFLLAVDTIETSLPPLKIIAVDTANPQWYSTFTLKEGKNPLTFAVTPDDAVVLSRIQDYARKNGTYILNNTNMRDTSYVSNPYLIHGTIPSQRMLEKAADAFVESLNGAQPVIVSFTDGKEDKAAFIDLVKNRCLENGIVPQVVTVDGTLTLNDLESQIGLPEPGKRMVLVPTSGSLARFNKIAGAIHKFRDKSLESGGDVSVWGYPEWVTFRGENRKLLHEIDVTLYSRSYSDASSREASGVGDGFINWYGNAPEDGVPVMGLLGYDSASWIMKAISGNAYDDFSPELISFRGIQSAFNFKRVGVDGGVVNDALYIVRFMPGEVVYTTVM